MPFGGYTSGAIELGPKDLAHLSKLDRWSRLDYPSDNRYNLNIAYNLYRRIIMPAEHQEVSAMTGTPREVQDMLANLPDEQDTQVVALTVPHADARNVDLIAKYSAVVFRDLLLERGTGPTEKRDLSAYFEAVSAAFKEVSAETIPATPHLLREAAMRHQARAAVLASGDWLTARQVADIAGLSLVNPSAQPNKWKRAGQIFAIQHGGTDLFPGYGLDPDTDYRPRKALADIIQLFADHKRGWGMAFWFMSVNSFLGGRRPQDVLAHEPEWVIAAAEDEIQPICHG